MTPDMIPEEIAAFLAMALQWLRSDVLVITTLLESLASLSFLLIAVWISKTPRNRMEAFFHKHWQQSTLDKYNEEALLSLVTPSIAMLLHWAAITVTDATASPNQLLQIIAKLLTAWIIIRLSTALVRQSSWSQFIAVIAWGIAALSITGLLTPTLELLDGVSFQAGELHISLLGTLKGIATLIVMLWLAGVASRFTEHRIQAMPNLTPSAQVLLSKFLKISLITLALLVGINSLGIDLTALAVFSGAIGLGLGFGLQKVVSNLISGVILLMDRSVKPGDVIEIDETYGWVNKLGARYVSVLTRDGVEHLIPNENLITERVTNWSYSSTKVRIKIPIGVSYHADIHQAIDLMLQAAKAHDRVLGHPSPVCRLIAFGDSSVDFELRIWINDPIQGINNVRSDILLTVWDLFKEHKVEIPFPQRDIHIRSHQEAQIIDTLTRETSL